MQTDYEIEASVLAPYFDAVRDKFVSYDGASLKKLKKTKFLLEPSVHDSERHYAACREDGGLILFSPEVVHLEEESVVAIIAHEFGHAADFCYPAQWLVHYESRPAMWIGRGDTEGHRKWRKLWNKRNADQIEKAADDIAWAVLGKRITYCGSCYIQCFTGRDRPKGLR